MCQNFSTSPSRFSKCWISSTTPSTIAVAAESVASADSAARCWRAAVVRATFYHLRDSHSMIRSINKLLYTNQASTYLQRWQCPLWSLLHSGDNNCTVLAPCRNSRDWQRPARENQVKDAFWLLKNTKTVANFLFMQVGHVTVMFQLNGPCWCHSFRCRFRHLCGLNFIWSLRVALELSSKIEFDYW